MASLRAALTSSIASQGVATVVGIITVPLFLEAFGRTVYGYWAALLGVTGYLGMINVGITQAVSSKVSTAPAAERTTGTRLAIIAGLREYALICGVALPLAVGLCFVLPWAGIFHLDSSYARPAMYAALAVVVGFLIELPFTLFRAALYGLGEIALERGVFIVGTIARLGAAIVLARTHPPLWVAAVLLTGITLASHGGCLYFVRRRIGPVFRPRPERSQLPELRRTGLYFIVLHVGGMLVWNSDTVIVGAMLGAKEAAPIAVAWRVQLTALAISHVVAEALAPALAQRWADGDHEGAARLSLVAGQGTVACVSLLLLCLLSGGRTLFHYWTGEAMFVGEVTWAVYCTLMIVQSFLVIPHYFVVQAGQHERYAGWALAEGVVKVGAGVALFSWLGIAGIPLTTIIGRLLVAAPAVIRAYTSALQLSLRRWIVALARPLVVGAPVFFALFVGGSALGGMATHPRVIGLTAACAGGFAVAVLIFGLDAHTRAALMRMLPSTKRTG